MSLSTYCDPSEVRSALGVNSTELKDTVLALPVYEMGLVRELNKLSTTLTAAFSLVLAKIPQDRSAEEAALFSAVRLFSVYAVAKQVGVSLANFAPKDVGDGKASISRFAGEPFEKTLSRVNEYYGSLREDLRNVYASYSMTPTSAPVTAGSGLMFRAAARGTDPVTGS